MNRARTVVYLFSALTVGLLFSMVWKLDSLTRSATSLSRQDTREMLHSDPTLMIDDTEARALKSRGRVLCWIPSVAYKLHSKIRAVNSTWIQRCDGHIFFIEGLNPQPPDVVSLDVLPGYYNLTAKVVSVFQYLYHHHLHDYDWFLKGDDDAYIIVENLRYVLAQYDPGDPVYVGHLYKQRHKHGYMSGGASYAFSREALKRVVEDGYMKDKCATKGRYEDVEIGKCLHNVGVASHNSRDRFDRDMFHPLRPSIHIAGPIPANQIPQDRFLMVSGEECCSQLTVSFHKVEPELMKVMDHLLYRTTVYGRQPDMKALQALFKPAAVPPLL
ncbi:glycoprotein-N-acetylgalactosamine 3-beta-galactosyltransferase 1-like [Littorina saxatilis]|uniref:N-acetylgalactosaminide beta-1,3-galactosyltransferase n=1 Tax=Littorina saxatilis TaxID=31220 RepID=A0AAN9B8Z3_9CAEN